MSSSSALTFKEDLAVQSIRVLVAALLVLTAASLALAGGEKVAIAVADVGVVKIKPTCLGETSVLEVEVEVKGIAADTPCTVSVSSPAGSGSLPDFTTDDEGEGETQGYVPVAPEVGEPLLVTVTIQGAGAMPIVAEAEVTFEKPCEDD
jgi:hypothetical protein